jgi:uncharacterized repeat protein (TIGR03806 family)
MCDRFRRALVAWSLVTFGLMSLNADAQTRWTTSKISGTPDPAPPYKVELAFPKIKLERPILLDHVPGTTDLVVAELMGKVLTFPNDRSSDKTHIAIDLTKERPGLSALYGLAFHPKFDTNHYVYLCYVMKNETPDGTRVSRFKATSVSPLKLDATTEEIVLTYPSGGHNGGCLAFGPDGFLYISTGDATAPTPPDQLKTGQDISDLLSSILRIDVDQRDPGRPYRIPPDNPFVKTPKARPEVWAFGLRNPWRMSFDRQKGDLWVGDVGWELWEMIHLVRRGQNCGWSAVEASQPVLVDVPRGPTPIVPPVVSHPHSEAASITGGYVYHGKNLPKLQNVYIYGDYQSGLLWGLRHDGEKVVWKGLLADTGLRLVAFGEDRTGEIYLVEHDRTNGIYKLVPNPDASSQSMFPRKLSETGLFRSTHDLTPQAGVVPYKINASQWSDGARAERVMAIPTRGKIEIDGEGRWSLPDGSVLAKTIAIETVPGDLKTARKIETQILHRESQSWRAYSYAWNESQSDAELVDAPGMTKSLSSGQHSYRFSSRAECVLCHKPWIAAGSVFGRQSASPLALNSIQLNRDQQFDHLFKSGYLDTPGNSTTKMVDPADVSARLEDRARTYLSVNCSHCHQFNAGGTAAIELSLKKSLKETLTIDVAPAQGRFGIDDARLIAPGEPDRSILFYRISKTGSGRMPRLGSEHVDPLGSKLIGDWIASMPRAGGSKPLTLAQEKALELLTDPSSTPASRSEAFAVILASTRASLALLRAIESKETPEPLKSTIARASAKSSPEVRDLFERFLPANERLKRLGDGFDVAALLAIKADPAAGRALFRADGGITCKSCHKSDGIGGEVGPALDGVGSKYVLKELLNQVIEPSRVVDPKYHTHVVVTKSGQVHTGLLIEESSKEVVLRNATGQSIRLPIVEIEERARVQRSIMPEGQLRDLTAQQAADLLAYLASLKKMP